MENIAKYEKIFMEIFGITKDRLNETLIYNSIVEWDSVGHMSLIAALEETYDIMLDTDDIIEFSSFVKGMEILQKYGVEM